MERRLYLFILLVLSFVYVNAQDNNIEKVYFKNGAVINGTVVEQIPNKTIKIVRDDGNTFVYNFSEIEKIEGSFSKNGNESIYLNDGNVLKGHVVNQTDGNMVVETEDGEKRILKLEEIKKISKEPIIQVGRTSLNEPYILGKYRGFADVSYGFSQYNRLSISTSHGRQINNILFVGGGYAMNFNFDVVRRHEVSYGYYKIYNSKYVYTEEMCFVFALFADARVDFARRKTSPFVDVRMGIDHFDSVGFYSRLSAGARLKRLNVFLGAEFETLKGADRLELDIINNSLPAFCVGMGFDFGKRNKID